MPTAIDDVLIDIPGSAAVTVRSGTATAHSVVSNNPLSITGGTLNLAGGAIQVNNTFLINGGTLQNAVVNAGTGGQGITVGTAGNSRLIASTVNSDINFDQTSAQLRVSGGLTLNGTAHLSAGDAQFLFEGGNIVSAGTFVFDGTSASVRDLGFWGNASVTFAPGVVIRGGVGRIGQHRGIGGSGQVINQGTISADVAGKTISIEPTNQTANTFTNSGGTLEAKNGGTLTVLKLAGNLGNATVTGTGSSLSLDGTGWTNNATLAIPTGTTATLSRVLVQHGHPRPQRRHPQPRRRLHHRRPRDRHPHRRNG